VPKPAWALGLREADVQARAPQHPDEPQDGQEGARGDAAYGDNGGEQENHAGRRYGNRRRQPRDPRAARCSRLHGYPRAEPSEDALAGSCLLPSPAAMVCAAPREERLLSRGGSQRFAAEWSSGRPARSVVMRCQNSSSSISPRANRSARICSAVTGPWPGGEPAWS